MTINMNHVESMDLKFETEYKNWVVVFSMASGKELKCYYKESDKDVALKEYNNAKSGIINRLVNDNFNF